MVSYESGGWCIPLLLCIPLRQISILAMTNRKM